MTRKTKLELTWIGKEERPKLEPRILIEDPALGHHARAKRRDASGNDLDRFDNMLIQGDNLLALKALEQEYAGRVKCVFIDPPYNTGSAFDHYDDGLEHSLWLSMMRDRLEIIRNLMAQDGSLWITIDDNEAHYLKVLCDEIIGRNNFITSIAWQKMYTTKNSARHFSSMHDYLIVYAKSIDHWERRDLPRTAKQDDAYKNPDSDPRGPWKATPLHARNYYSKGLYRVVSPSGRIIDGPPKGRYWSVAEEKFAQLNASGQIWWGESGDNMPAQKRFLNDVQGGVVPSTWWSYEDAGHNAEAKNEIRALNETDTDIFITPKPEKLIRRVLEIASAPGDLVLDSFAGSGTTGAVAHKMGRRWIMVELGDHAVTHIVPRLKKVIDGEDKGGVTEAMGWAGGGGFRFFRLAPSLLQKDRFGHWVIAKDYNAAMLAEAVCKLMGFTYAPAQDETEWWRHGHSTETDFIHVTTQSLTHDALKKLADEVGPERTCLVCCKAFQGPEDAFENLTIRKIPHAVLQKCEWGRDDYSLRVANLPTREEPEPEVPAPANARGRKTREDVADLFGMESDQ